MERNSKILSLLPDNPLEMEDTISWTRDRVYRCSRMKLSKEASGRRAKAILSDEDGITSPGNYAGITRHAGIGSTESLSPEHHLPRKVPLVRSRSPHSLKFYSLELFVTGYQQRSPKISDSFSREASKIFSSKD
jgi:hypothetical protein